MTDIKERHVRRFVVDPRWSRKLYRYVLCERTGAWSDSLAEEQFPVLPSPTKTVAVNPIPYYLLPPPLLHYAAVAVGVAAANGYTVTTSGIKPYTTCHTDFLCYCDSLQ